MELNTPLTNLYFMGMENAAFKEVNYDKIPEVIQNSVENFEAFCETA